MTDAAQHDEDEAKREEARRDTENALAKAKEQVDEAIQEGHDQA